MLLMLYFQVLYFYKNIVTRLRHTVSFWTRVEKNTLYVFSLLSEYVSKCNEMICNFHDTIIICFAIECVRVIRESPGIRTKVKERQITKIYNKRQNWSPSIQ